MLGRAIFLRWVIRIYGGMGGWRLVGRADKKQVLRFAQDDKS